MSRQTTLFGEPEPVAGLDVGTATSFRAARQWLDRLGFPAFSACGRYRYTLPRFQLGFEANLRTLVCIGQNPSTADDSQDDQTLRKVQTWARLWGYGRVIMLNLFALRSTNQLGLLAEADPVGPLNDHVIRMAVALEDVDLVLCAWGTGKTPAIRDMMARRADAVRAIVGEQKPLVCVGKNADGTPKHPCRLANASMTEVWP